MKDTVQELLCLSMRVGSTVVSNVLLVLLHGLHEDGGTISIDREHGANYRPRRKRQQPEVREISQPCGQRC